MTYEKHVFVAVSGCRTGGAATEPTASYHQNNDPGDDSWAVRPSKIINTYVLELTRGRVLTDNWSKKPL